MKIPVARPLMPRTEHLVPYLRRIDDSRVYTNFGSLTLELERRLGERLGVGPKNIVTVSNATAGLSLALMALTAGRTNTCFVPAWTFVATAHAIISAGLVPVLIDVDENTWATTVEIARAAADQIGDVGAIIPIAPFGAPLDVELWDRFTAETGIPAIIDAAAAHDSLCIGRNPSVISLHATKILGTGEGGYIVSADSELIVEIKKRANFGFYNSRNAQFVGQNAKLSEYHAAVGLASLDNYAETRKQFMRVATMYRSELGAANRVIFQEGFGEGWVSSVCTIRAIGADASKVAASLAQRSVDTRAWWGGGLHRHSAFVDLRRFDLSVTNRLAAQTIGLPFYVDMNDDEVTQVTRGLIEYLSSSGAMSGPEPIGHEK